ncbi:MAG: sugar 3,4-ketoisomerase [Candidatus Berkiellales bacterium]
MAYIIELPIHTDPRGSLTVIEKVLPFTIKRVYWITELGKEARGKHRHHLTWQAMVCLQGQCEIVIKKEAKEQIYQLEKPNQTLILAPEDWHEMRQFKQNPILLVMASHEFDPADYIKEP